MGLGNGCWLAAWRAAGPAWSFRWLLGPPLSTLPTSKTEERPGPGARTPLLCSIGQSSHRLRPDARGGHVDPASSGGGEARVDILVAIFNEPQPVLGPTLWQPFSAFQNTSDLNSFLPGNLGIQFTAESSLWWHWRLSLVWPSLISPSHQLPQLFYSHWLWREMPAYVRCGPSQGAGSTAGMGHQVM